MRTFVAIALLAAPTASACTSLPPDAAGAAEVAQAFHTALHVADRTTLCALLAEATAEQVEKTTHSTCPDGILDRQIPDADRVHDVSAYGRAAQVRMNGDTVFLTREGESWKIAAAGCQYQGNEPYDCVLEGK
ncbi:hypothetical protein [Rhodococcus globerulus]|uniref:hypothetical protein n=1 Tax=Rhodococcus globerulus TaxID=33008 RepID=UPI0011121D7A|nr:hypothetical protein [Rhodococcus globerulus]